MQRRSLVPRLITLLVAVTLLPSVAAAKPATPTPQAESTQGAAIGVARDFIARVAQTNTPEWADVTLGQPTLFVRPDGAPSVYVIDLKSKAGTAAGFIAVSADEAQPRVVEFSQAEAPQLRVAEAQAKSDRSSTPQLVHAGPTMFQARWNAGSQGGPATMDLMTLDAVTTDAATADTTSTEMLTSDPDTLTEAPVVDSTTSYTITSKQIASFPTNFNQNNLYNSSSACGPAAGATLVDYWALTRYYTTLMSTYKTWVAVGNKLYSDMGTTSLGTTTGGWTTGLRYFTNTRSGYNFTYYTIDGTVTDYYGSYKSEINLNRPTGIYIGKSSWYNDTFEYHFMAAYGYYHDPARDYKGIYVATNWGYSDSVNYDYYRNRYTFYYFWVRP